MGKLKRNAFDKLKTLLFWKDTRVTDGEPYTIVKEFDFSSYCPIEKYVNKIEIPNKNTFNINDFGAIANNKEFDNAKPINDAISAAEKTSGTILIIGGDFTSSEILLKSNVTVFIASDSAIIAKENRKGYPNKALIFANGAKNITFTGGGKIKGNGNFFGLKPVFNENQTQPAEYIDMIELRQDYRKQIRFAHKSKYGSPVILKNCQNINVNNIIIENSASWSFRTDNCSNISFSNFVINNNRNVANADGIDICGSSNININHCFISTADDGIVIKNAIWLGCKNEMKNININDCEIISRTNSIKIGTETTFNISDVKIENCKFLLPDLYPYTVSGLAIEAVDGSEIYNVFAKNIEIYNCSCPIFIRLGNRNRAAEVTEQSANAIEYGQKAEKGVSADKNRFNFKSEIHDLQFENIKAFDTEAPIMICGFKQKGKIKRVKNICFKNIEINCTTRKHTIDKRLFIPEYAKEYPECNRFRNLPSYFLFIRHAENIKFENCKCNGQSNYKKENYIKDLKP